MAKKKQRVEKEFKGFDFKALREAKGKTVEAAAEEMGISVAKLTAIEEFDESPKTGKAIKAITKAYDLDPVNVKCFMGWRAEQMKEWNDSYYVELAKRTAELDAEWAKNLPKSDAYAGEGLEEAGYYDEEVEVADEDLEAAMKEDAAEEAGDDVFED